MKFTEDKEDNDEVPFDEVHIGKMFRFTDEREKYLKINQRNYYSFSDNRIITPGMKAKCIVFPKGEIFKLEQE